MRTTKCIHELRGGEAKCNGGGYDGCACGPYTVADFKAAEEATWTRTVGVTKYRPCTDPADLVGAIVMNADVDALYLENRVTHRKFVVSLQVAYGDAVEEYKSA